MSQYGAYQLVRRIGWGPGGPVYVAQGPQGEVSIRQFQSDRSPDERGERERFLAAGRLQMSVSDPSIVPTLEVIDSLEPASVVMMYVQAETLQTALLSRTFSPEEANVLLRRVALALDYAHSHGVVHGDLKPSSIFLLPKQEIMVGDFAISPNARRDPRQPLPSHLRHAYLSPEHFNCPMFLDGRSDQFSLAVIAYEMYTGQLPFGSKPDHLTAVLGADAAPSRVNPKLPPGVDEPLLRALSHNPEQRFSSCMEFVSELSAAMLPIRGKAHRTLGILVLSGGLAAVLAIIAVIVIFRPTRKPPLPAPVTQASQSTPPVTPVPAQQQSTSTLTPAPAPPAPKTSSSTAGGSNPAAPIRRPKDKPKPAPVPVAAAPIPPVPPGPDVSASAPRRSFTIEVLSRTRRLSKGVSFSIGDRTLGLLGHGDLKALVRLEGPPVPPNHLTIEWTVSGIVMDRQKPISPDNLIEYDNEPTSGSYKVVVRLDGQTVDEFSFQITPDGGN